MQVLVDSSIWIDLLSKKPHCRLNPEDFLRIGVCSPVIQEVIQGIRESTAEATIQEAMLALRRYSDPIPVSIYLSAAEIYSRGRRKGYSIRSSTDCLIAAIAIENNVAVWHTDRDYELIAKFTALRTFTGNYLGS